MILTGPVIEKRISQEERTRDTISTLLIDFDCGELVSYSKVKEGRSSITYFATVAEGETYVIRFFKLFSLAKIKNEIYVQNLLQESSVITPILLQTPAGSWLYDRANVKATVSKYIHGHSPELPLTEEYCYMVGRELGRFHVSLADYKLPGISAAYFLNNITIRKRLRVGNTEAYWQTILEAFYSCRLEDAQKLPKGILHGDLHSGNVLICDKEIAIIDLQSLHKGPYILDIGRSIADICSTPEGLDPDRLDAYLRGYQEIRKLTDQEWQKLYSAISYGAVAISTWFYVRNDIAMANYFLRVITSIPKTKANSSFPFTS